MNKIKSLNADEYKNATTVQFVFSRSSRIRNLHFFIRNFYYCAKKIPLKWFKYLPNKTLKSGFSLVEMLMALLVASLLLAVLAPVMTRKMNENVNVNGVGGESGSSIESHCWSMNSGGNEGSMQFDSSGNRLIKYTIEPDVHSVNFAVASGGGGGGGASVSNSTDKTLTGGYGTQLKIEPYMDDFNVMSIIGGGGGGGGGAGVNANETITGGPSVRKCGLLGGYEYVNGYCVSGSQGTATSDTAAGKCLGSGAKGNLNPSGKWSLPDNLIIQNWNSSSVSSLGINTGSYLWSSKTEPCTLDAYSSTKCGCTYNGIVRPKSAAYTSAASCCSGSSYGNPASDSRQCGCYYNGAWKTQSSSYKTAEQCCSGSSYGGDRIYKSFKWLSHSAPSYWDTTSNNFVVPNGYDDDAYFCVCLAGSGVNNDAKVKEYCPKGLHSFVFYQRTGGDEAAGWSCQENCEESCGGYSNSEIFYETSCIDSAVCTGTQTAATTCLSTASCITETTPEKSCGTYHYYYYWNGSTWEQRRTTGTSASYDVRCVYSGYDNVTTSVFHSLSGGGGGSAPALRNNGFDSNVLNTFRQRIKENVGGYIVLEVDTGGTGGGKSTALAKKAGDGDDGGRSCILIKGTDGSPKYRLCVPGGKAGGGARGNITNAHTGGYGLAGAATAVSNSCYAIDYTTNSAGVTKYFNCTYSGKAGENGAVGYNYPLKAVAGGKGGASPLNNIQVGGTNAVNGVNADNSNYGAGGGGGSAYDSGTYGRGGDGASGHIELKYKVKYNGAGGGGGGAGSLVVVREVSISPGAECDIIIGKGGAGGNVNQDGFSGGTTHVQCKNKNPITAFGASGGKKGISASTLGGDSTGGAGGSGGIAGGYLDEYPKKNLTIKDKVGGTAGGASGNYVSLLYSAGGKGGISITSGGENGACGALLNDESCNYDRTITPNLSELNGKSVDGDIFKFPNLQSVQNYGVAGHGGGGGAWHIQTGSGTGGAGLGGYVCIWWKKVE